MPLKLSALPLGNSSMGRVGTELKVSSTLPAAASGELLDERRGLLDTCERGDERFVSSSCAEAGSPTLPTAGLPAGGGSQPHTIGNKYTINRK